MYFRALEGAYLRKYTHLFIEIPTQGLALIGPNASGKTTILEAIHKMAILRGFGRDEEMIQWGSPGYRIRARLPDGIAEVRYARGQGTTVLWEGEIIQPLSRWVGRLPVVVLRPGEIEWIEGSAAFRRRWADRLLSQISPDYLNALSHYLRALAQRNALLAQEPLPHAQIESWEQLLLSYGPFLQKKRIELTEKLQTHLQSFYATLGSEPLHLYYKLSVEAEAPAWKKAWEKLRSKELALKRTLIGPHTEDFVIELQHKPARGYASEGQKKSLLIALKWAETAYLSGLQTKGPILLLDDIGEKLDAFRLRAVGQLARLSGQTFLTDVDPTRVAKAFPELPIHLVENL